VCAESGKDTPPSLKEFEDEIQRYKSMEKAMKSLPASKCIGWIKVDAKPLKKSLQSLVSKWSYIFIRYLQDKVINEMDELYQFMTRANQTLDLKVGCESAEEEDVADKVPEGVDPQQLKREREEEVCCKVQMCSA
jgi:hypothetical protein